MHNNCKIISVYFGKRRMYPYTSKNSIKVLKDVIKNEILLNPGVKQLDTILVNHNCGDEAGNKYLDSLTAFFLVEEVLVASSDVVSSCTI